MKNNHERSSLRTSQAGLSRRRLLGQVLATPAATSLPVLAFAQAANTVSMSPLSFKIDVPDAVLEDLQQRLARTRWPDQVENAGWDYGANLGTIQALTAYWRDGYDWRSEEARLNAFPQFKVKIEGIDVHYLHVLGKGPNPLPLLLTHGWSDTCFLYEKIIPLLTDPGAHGGNPEDAFTVIVPDIPGFGFSDRPTQPGWGPARMGAILEKLMANVLGHEKFVAHGEDFGASITELMALQFPQRFMAIHLTMLPPQHAQKADPSRGTAEERTYLREVAAYWVSEGGYAAMQSNKPQTLSYGLNDSPVGLLSWIIEKFHGTSQLKPDGSLNFSMDDLITNVMLCWITQTAGSAARIYYEKAHHPTSETRRVSVPTGFARFAHDNIPPPRAFVERFLNVHRWSEMPRGGHYPPLEVPNDLTAEITTYFREFRGSKKS